MAWSKWSWDSPARSVSENSERSSGLAMPGARTGRSRRRSSTGKPPTPIEGGWKPERMVIIEFPARDNAQAFLSDPEIQDLFKVRHATTTSRLVLADGCT